MKVDNLNTLKEYKLLGRSIKGIVFDMDGVIFDTEPLHRLAWTRALGEFGLEMTDEELIEWTGIPCRQLSDMLEKRWNGRYSSDEYYNLKEKHFYYLIGSQPSLFEGLDTCLGELGKFVPIALATSTTRINTELLLGKWNVGRYFKGSICFEDVVKHKPDPEAYLKGAGILNLLPENCIALDDSPTGCRSAKAAGMLTLGIAGVLPAAKLEMADRVFSSTRECCNWLLDIILKQN